MWYPFGLLCAVSDKQYRYQQCFYGVNLSSLRNAAVDEYFRQPIVDTFDVRILMARTVKYTVNFTEAEEEDLHRVEIPFVFQMMQSGLIHGLAFWFDVAFVGSLVTVWLSTAPTEPLTHWYQVRCLLQTPLFAKEGETLSGKVLFVANKRQSYDIQIVAVVDETGFKSGNVLDLKNPFFRSFSSEDASLPPRSKSPTMIASKKQVPQHREAVDEDNGSSFIMGSMSLPEETKEDRKVSLVDTPVVALHSGAILSKDGDNVLKGLVDRKNETAL
ncbi:UNVERIFIED_CONTAM: Histone-arginine methyltransferase carm1 [Gekko kuhli]